MNIEKIKWCIERAEGFELSKIRNNTIEMIDICGLISYAVESLNRTPSKVPWENVYKPLFLTRTIEGIEKTRDIEILAYWNKSGKCYESQIFKTENDFPDFQMTSTDHKSIDEAKQAAIDYVYDQENK